MAPIGKNLVEVGVSMVLRDQFSTEAGRISDSYARLMNDMNTYNRGISMSAGKMFDTGAQMVKGMFQAYQHSAQVSDQIFLTAKIAGATAKQQVELMKLAQEVNTKTPLTNMDISSGMKYLAMAGNSAEAIKSMITPAAELASIFDMQLGGKGGVADMMTNIMATFGIASEDAKATADILGVATTSANISLTDLAQSLQYSGATFRNAGVDLKTAAAAIGVLGDQGIQASSAGTALANMIRYMTLSITGQKAKGTDMLQALGISRDELVDSYGNLKRLDVLMKVMANHMQGLSGTAREQAMYNIFGVRGQRAASSLMQALWTGTDKMSTIMGKIDRSAGFTETTISERMKTPAGIIEMFNSQIDNLRTNVGATLAEVFNPILRVVSWVVDGITKFADTGLGGLLVKFTTWSTISLTLVHGYRLIRSTIAMVANSTTLASTAAETMANGLARANMNAGSLLTRLQTIVALQTIAGGMAPGTQMTLAGGYVLSKGKKGKYTMIGPDGTKYGTKKGDIGAHLNTIIGAGSSTPTSTTGNTGGGRTRVNAGLLGKLGKFGGLLGGVTAFLGGPLGIGLSIGLTALSYIMQNNQKSVDDNTKAIEKNTSEMTASEFRAHYEERFINALKAALRENGKDPMKLSLSVNGSGYSVVNNGDILDVDTWGTY